MNVKSAKTTRSANTIKPPRRKARSGGDPTPRRVPEKQQEERDRRDGHELEDWIAAEDRRLGWQLLPAVQRAGS